MSQRVVPELRAPLGLFRAALIAVCALLSLAPRGEPEALLVLLVLALGAWAAYRSSRFARIWPYTASLGTAAAVPFTGGGHSSLLPYLMASALTLGLTRAARQLFLVAGATSTVLLIGSMAAEAGTPESYLVGAAEWVLLSLAVGLVALWGRSTRSFVAESDQYVEMRHLLEQVRRLTRHLPGSLDATSAAETLLDRCAQAVSFERAAVIVQPGEGVFVPLAVKGVNRVPWRTPLADDGPLRQAWLTGRPTRDTRKVDIHGRRQGSTVLALPLPSREGPFALVVLESSAIDAFAENVIVRLDALVRQAGPQLETAMMFDEVRLEASTEERDRLAREMHDGIAQELAVLGYQLDQIAMQAQGVDAHLAGEVNDVRVQVTRLISELRLSITDLRTNLRPSRGLGAALSTYLPAVCSGREVVLNLSLMESPFRLLPEQEAGLLKAAQVFAQEVRRTPGVRTLTVHLVVDPPSAALELSCDRSLPDLRMDEIADFVALIGGTVTLSLGESDEPSLTITMKGRDDDDSAAGGRPRADQAGVAAGVRAD